MFCSVYLAEDISNLHKSGHLEMSVNYKLCEKMSTKYHGLIGLSENRSPKQMSFIFVSTVLFKANLSKVPNIIGLDIVF